MVPYGNGGGHVVGTMGYGGVALQGGGQYGRGGAN